jgi:hypothetical protein
LEAIADMAYDYVLERWAKDGKAPLYAKVCLDIGNTLRIDFQKMASGLKMMERKYREQLEEVGYRHHYQKEELFQLEPEFWPGVFSTD